MSLPFTDSEDEGLRFPPCLDGSLLYQGGDGTPLWPGSFHVTPIPIQEHVDTLDGGSQVFQYTFGLGHSDFSERHIFRLPYNNASGPLRKALERARKMGRIHSFAYWKPVSEFYTSPGGAVFCYLPHYRRNAGQVLAGLNYDGHVVGTDTFPMLVWVAGVAQTVTYEDGPTLTVPDAGTVVVSKEPDDTGHVPFRFNAALAQGTLVEIEYFPVFYVTIASVQFMFPKGMVEQQTYELQER